MQLVANNPQVQSSIAALPAGFLVTTTSATGRQVMKPMPRSEFRKRHG